MPFNDYTFTYRKKMAQFQQKFGFYDAALQQLKQILKDEISHYKLEDVVKEESKIIEEEKKESDVLSIE